MRSALVVFLGITSSLFLSAIGCGAFDDSASTAGVDEGAITAVPTSTASGSGSTSLPPNWGPAQTLLLHSIQFDGTAGLTVTYSKSTPGCYHLTSMTGESVQTT